MKKMCFVVNPRSGRMKIKPNLLDVIQIFNQGGYSVNVTTTLYRGHAIEVAQNIDEGTDIIVVSGGDGTLNEVITGLLKSNKTLPVGYIPTGSTNDFASSIGISQDPKTAAEAIINGAPFETDIGSFDGKRYFSYIASFGVFTAVSYSTPQNFKNNFGHLAYVLEGLKDITKLTPYKVRVETPDNVYEGNYIFGSVTNTTSVGGIVKLDKDIVKMNDGLFEIVLVKNPTNINDVSKIIGGCSTSNFTDSVFEFIKAPCVTMTFEKEMNWSIDGEHERSSETVKIENIKRAVSIIH